MKYLTLDTNHEYKFCFGTFTEFYGIVLNQRENWVKIRYTGLFKNGKTAFINLERVVMIREV